MLLYTYSCINYYCIKSEIGSSIIFYSLPNSNFFAQFDLTGKKMNKKEVHCQGRIEFPEVASDFLIKMVSK